MFQYCKHDNRKVDHSVRLAAVLLLGAACAPAFARPPVGNGGQGSRRFQPMPLQPADLNGDHVVNAADRDLFMDAWAAAASGAAPGQADLDQDGVITLADLNILEAAAGLPLTAPPASEPSGSSSFDWRADLNGNGVVDFPDLQMFLLAWSASTSGADPGQADINMDGLLNFTDLAILISLFGANVSPPSASNVLAPGDGFTGPTPQPAAIGVPGSPGYDAKAIARWDVVPYQEFDGEFNVGVVAFHMNGIDRVEFSVENGPWTPVTTLSLNERTGVWEYWATLHADDFNDELVEVRAIVYPTTGIPRVLQGEIDGGLAFKNGNHSMFLTPDHDDSLPHPVVWCSPAGDDATGDGSEANPFRQPARAAASMGNANGGVVYLKEGEYSFGPAPYPPATADMRWLTVSAAPGVDRRDVVMNSSVTGGFGNRARLLRLKDITIKEQPRLAGQFIWFDSCAVLGDRTANYSIIKAAWAKAYFVTDTYVSDSRNGLRGADFMRNVEHGAISGSPFGDSPFVVNSTVDRYDNSGTTFHGDVFHWFPTTDDRENYIAYGIRAHDFGTQGLMAEVATWSDPQGVRMDNVAIVNVHIDQGVGYTGAAGSWWERSTNHLLFWQVNLHDQPMRWKLRDFGTSLRNVSIRGSIFEAFSYDDPAQEANAIVEQNHFVNPTTYGAFASGSFFSTGSPGFMNPATHDFRPNAGSILNARVALTASCPPIDAENAERSEMTAVGSFAGELED